MSQQPGKDTIYIDIDDEITAIIDKVRSSHERIVALVLPKRATVFQSIVNMKLLKRTADDAKKHLVLITNEAGLLPLAGSVGIYVAKTLQSRPEIPVVPGAGNHQQADEDEAVNMAETPEDKLDLAKPVGAYTKSGGTPGTVVPPDEDTPIELDNTSPAATVGGDGAVKAGKKPKKSGKKFSIPDFNKFRTWLILGGVGLVVFIFLWYMAFVAMPRAKVTVKTDSTAVQATFDAELDTEADSVDVDERVIPAVMQQTQKTGSQQVEATGQKDKGTKATGQISASTPCGADFPSDVPAGTAVSAGDLTYITQEPIEFGAASPGGGKCVFAGKADVIAQQNGDKYNAGARGDYKLAGYPNFTVTGSGMAGGTSQVVKVITQADIDSASQKINAQDTNTVKSELQRALESQQQYVIDETFVPGKAEVTTSAKIGDEAPNVTVTQRTTYSMVGVKQADLKKMVDNALTDKIDPSKQSILDYGLEEAVFKLQSQRRSATLVSVNTTAIAGSDLNLVEIKKQIGGKKANSAKEIIGKYPGVTDVKVDYSPFWVSSIPKKESKITVTVEKPVLGNAKEQ